jgi:hypothetical protein
VHLKCVNVISKINHWNIEINVCILCFVVILFDACPVRSNFGLYQTTLYKYVSIILELAVSAVFFFIVILLLSDRRTTHNFGRLNPIKARSVEVYGIYPASWLFITSGFYASYYLFPGGCNEPSFDCQCSNLQLGRRRTSRSLQSGVSISSPIQSTSCITYTSDAQDRRHVHIHLQVGSAALVGHTPPLIEPSYTRIVSSTAQ